MNDNHPDLGGPGAGTDQLEERFRALRVDTDSVILAESSAVRRRGERRRRTTQAGTVLGIAVLAVAVVGVATTLTDRPTAAPPAATSPSPQDSAPMSIMADDPFLKSGDLSPVGPYTFTNAAPGTSEMRLPCLSDPATWGPLRATSRIYSGELEATFVETVLNFTSVAAATTAAERPVTEFGSCPEGDPAEGTVVDRTGALSVGDQSSQFSRATTPTTDADLGYNEVAVARHGSVVVILDWSSQGSPVDAPGWAWTSPLLATALDRAVAR